jgi:hypothetical protein
MEIIGRYGMTNRNYKPGRRVTPIVFRQPWSKYTPFASLSWEWSRFPVPLLFRLSTWNRSPARQAI